MSDRLSTVNPLAVAIAVMAHQNSIFVSVTLHLMYKLACQWALPALKTCFPSLLVSFCT